MNFWLFCQTHFDIKKPLLLLERSQYDVKLKFPFDKYPETARDIKNAIKKGASAVCTIDKEGADKNGEESLKNIQVKREYDRDEFPMAMCEEGGAGADIE